MKKLYLYFTALLSTGLYSQSVLNQVETGSRTVADPQAVILTQGFHASSNVSNPFIAKIGPSTDNPTNPTNSNAGSTNPSGNVGDLKFNDTQGKIDVNGGGQLQYTLPIALPPGIKGVVPQIDLMYISGSGNGIAGYGWGISGLTTISRVGRNIDKDGEVKGIQLDYSDYYNFNGQRLILKQGTGSYGSNGSEYVIEKYSNAKIKAFGSINSQQWQGPEYWEVTFEDGSQAWYGATSTGGIEKARTPMEYNIVKWKDAQGNYITYNYSQVDNVAAITSIQYGGNESSNVNTSHFNEVVFDYSIDSDFNEVSYIKGVKFVQNNKLDLIRVISDLKTLRRYAINYENPEVNNGQTNIKPKIKYRFVKSIQESVSDEDKANPVTFTSNPLETGFEEKPFKKFDEVIASGDFNGDGLVDVIVKQPAQNSLPAGNYLYFDGSNVNATDFVYLGTTSSWFPGLNSDSNTQILPFKIKPSDNFVKAKQGLVTIQSRYGLGNVPKPGYPHSFGITINYYSIKTDNSVLNSTTNALVLEYSKVIDNESFKFDMFTYPDIPDPGYSYSEEGEASTFLKAAEVDIDSDGLSELLLSIYDKKCYEVTLSYEPEETVWYQQQVGMRYMVIDQEDLTNDYAFHITAPMEKNIFGNSNASSSSIMDFDNDGVQDIVSIEATPQSTQVSYQTGSSSNLSVDTKINNFYQYSISKHNNQYVITLKKTYTVKGLYYGWQFADLNGDGNMEVLLPLAITDRGGNTNGPCQSCPVTHTGWSIYLNTGNDLKESFRSLIPFNPSPDETSSNRTSYYNQAFMDIDGDGKTDIIATESDVNIANNIFTTHFHLSILSGFQFNDNDNLGLKWRGETLIESNRQTFDRSVVSPVFGNYRINKSNHRIMLMVNNIDNQNDKKVLFYNNFNLANDSKIRRIEQGEVPYEIDYREVDPNVNYSVYAPIQQEIYPYVEVERLPEFTVVATLRRLSVFQEFKYRGYLYNLHGKGNIGFRKVARTNWYAPGTTKIWSVAEVDPLNEALPIKEWSVKFRPSDTNENNVIFTNDFTNTNSSLVSYKEIEYIKDKLLNGQVVNFFTDFDRPNIVKAYVPWKTTTKDILKDITTFSEITYGNYYLPAQTNTSFNNGFATESVVMSYTHKPTGSGKDYYIGRPFSKTQTTTAYNDTKVAVENYDYTNNQLSQLTKKTATSSRFSINELYKYDNWGNTIEIKTSYKRAGITTPPSLIQTEKAEYDNRGRFVIKKIDNLNLETQLSYDEWGMALTQISPLGVTLTNNYDGWNKLLTSVNNLSGKTSYQYERVSSAGTGNTYNKVVTEYFPDGNKKISHINPLGLTVKVLTKAFGQNKMSTKSFYYDLLGRLKSESEPYYQIDEYPKSNVKDYDDNDFPTKVTATSFTGKIIETFVSGRTTSVKELNGNMRTTSQTIDPLGNIITSTDKGGTIDFTYNAAGQQISARYDTNTVTTAYDDWGRKIEFNDPSNGIYTYLYDGFGRTLKETSPKGTKEYTYNSFGQLATQKELSSDNTSTNKNIAYSYNPKGLITSKAGTANGKVYSSLLSYDDYGRVISSSENSNGKYFMKKGITYDGAMRVISYEKSLYSSGQYTKVIIENIYSPWSGELYQIRDKTQNKVLWELQSSEADGRVLSAKLGGTAIINSYNNANFLKTTTHNNSVSGAMFLKMSYTFDALKNELTYRKREGGLGIEEYFDYDDNNRLKNWTDPVTGIKPQDIRNTYDIKGRITNNDQVGEIKFANSNKVYQATGMVLNNAGQQNFNQNLLQKIIYNENNDPIFIDGMKGDVAFTYGLTNMRQIATYGGDFGKDGTGKYTKYYSEDGSYEIVRNNQTGHEKHILYIGGTPYDTDIVYLKDYAEGNGSYKFLHKDYLGSILAISDEVGNAIEQRHYDAWGQFTHLKVGSLSMIVGVHQVTDYLANNSLLLDRGYTSHEHFSEVGLIHMNGRLYDPLLRRFLNADENIQDMFNTQNYNKYGYVLNNPLMYNDPNGEFIWFLGAAWAASTIITGVIVGAAIGAGMYLYQAARSGSWSWGAFGKSIFIGAFTGAVSGYLGHAFSASGFWATVGNGALAGAGSGGITSMVNGQNFAEGVFKGAVIGGAIAGISYTINFYTNPRTQELTKAEYDSHGIEDSGKALDPSVKTLREMYHNAEWDKMNTGAENFYVDHVSDGYTKSGDFYINPKGEEVIAYTRRNFSGKSSISFSKHAFGSKIKLGFVMTHELGHSTLNLYRNFNALRFDKTTKGYVDANIPGQGVSVDHAAIWGLEHDYIIKNGLQSAGLPGFFDNSGSMQGIFNSNILKSTTYNQLYEKIKNLSVKIK